MADVYTPILLASSSIYRRQLLTKVGLEFDWQAPDIDEQVRMGESAAELVVRLACEKAQALAAQYPEHIIIGSDQVAVLSTEPSLQDTLKTKQAPLPNNMVLDDEPAQAPTTNQILGKPGTYANATAQLRACSGQRVTFYTGLCVYHPATRTQDSLVSPFEVGFRELSDAEIDAYVSIEQPFDCAGSFKSEGLGISLFQYMRGDDPNSLIGLPLIELLGILRRRYQISPLQAPYFRTQ